MWKFIKSLFRPTISYEDAMYLHAKAKQEGRAMVDDLEAELAKWEEVRNERERKHEQERRRIESMFERNRLGLVSDEEFSAFLLE
jgi:uncharacterized protein (DUF1499 family)